MIIRNEDKFSCRNKSKRSAFEMAIIRPEIVAMIWNARSQLSFQKPSNTSCLDLSSFEFTTTTSTTAISLDTLTESNHDPGKVYLEADVTIHVSSSFE